MDKTRKHIKFIDETHQYFNIETGEEYLSTSKFLSNYFSKFNADEIAYKLITTNSRYKKKYKGLAVEKAVETLKGEWGERTRIGNEVHEILENHSLGIGEENEYTRMLDNLELEKRYPDYEIVPEMILFSDKYKIAGQADLLFMNHQTEMFKISDYKTCEKGIQKRSYKDERMLSPLEHLPDSNYYRYSLQLTVYAQMFIEETGYRCEGLDILWVDTNDLVIREYPVGSHWGDVAQILSERLEALKKKILSQECQKRTSNSPSLKIN